MHTWTLTCSPTPETLDRILAPFRKRGIIPEKFIFEQSSGQCMISFSAEDAQLTHIRANLLRIEDVQDVNG